MTASPPLSALPPVSLSLCHCLSLPVFFPFYILIPLSFCVFLSRLCPISLNPPSPSPLLLPSLSLSLSLTGRTPVGKSSGGASDPLWEGLLLFVLFLEPCTFCILEW